MRTRGPVPPTAIAPRATRPHRTARFVRRWWRYWLRMSLIGLIAGIVLGGLLNEAHVATFNYIQPTHATPTTSATR